MRSLYFVCWIVCHLVTNHLMQTRKYSMKRIDSSKSSAYFLDVLAERLQVKKNSRSKVAAYLLVFKVIREWSIVPLLLSRTSVLTAPTLALISLACLESALVSIGSSFSTSWSFELTSLAGGGTGVTTGLSAAASLFTSSTCIGPVWLFKWIWNFLGWWELGVCREVFG